MSINSSTKSSNNRWIKRSKNNLCRCKMRCRCQINSITSNSGDNSKTRRGVIPVINSNIQLTRKLRKAVGKIIKSILIMMTKSSKMVVSFVPFVESLHMIIEFILQILAAFRDIFESFLMLC